MARARAPGLRFVDTSAAELHCGGGYDVRAATMVGVKRTDLNVLSNGVEYLWTGDRWQSAPDKVKDHDFQ
jgi:hypothetical protein